MVLCRFISSLAAAAILVAATTAVAQDNAPAGSEEKFVPGSGGLFCTATIELKPQASIIGEEVKLKSLCRWSDGDRAALAPVADLVVLRVKRTSPFRTISVDDLRETLRDAGLNLATVRFAGATSCSVTRSDAQLEERGALEQWIASRETPATRPSEAVTATSTTSSNPSVPAVAAQGTLASARIAAAEEPRLIQTLRDYLIADVCQRLSLPADQLQLSFNPADEKLLSLCEPHFKFNIKPPRNRGLGEIGWDLTIFSGDAAQKATVTANVKAWQTQLVVNKPLGYRQVIREEDLIERRTLADRLGDDPLITREQAIGQMASRDLKPGSVMTARLIEPAILVKPGQLVTITLAQGGVQAKSVARSMEQGTLGQTIRVKNEVTQNVFDVIVNGPQSASMPASSPRPEMTDSLK